MNDYPDESRNRLAEEAERVDEWRRIMAELQSGQSQDPSQQIIHDFAVGTVEIGRDAYKTGVALVEVASGAVRWLHASLSKDKPQTNEE